MIEAEVWWALGLTLAERVGEPPLPPSSAHLAETPAAPGAHGAPAGPSPRPSWVSVAERGLAAAPVDPPPCPPGTPWDAGFAAILSPFVENAADELLERAPGSGTMADLAALRSCFTDQLAARLVALARRTLILRVNLGREAGRLRGDTPQERFTDFVRQSSGRSGLRALLTEYPVLARLLGQTCEQDVDAWQQLLARLAEDRADLVATMWDGVDPGLLTEVACGAGDRHEGGRSVALLRFESGAELVFKPRPLAVHEHFNQVVGWLNARLPQPSLRTLRVLARPGHGWVEFAAAAPCTERTEVERFYRRLGVLLALVHALGGTDLHAENLIACADQPVPVDLETLFHPAFARATTADPALATLDASVRRTALLPSLVVGDQGALDVSGLGGDEGAPLPEQVTGWEAPATDEMRLVRTTGVFRGAANRPSLDGVAAEPGAFTESLVAGFRSGYGVIAAHRAELLAPGGLLARFADDGTRVVLRNTRWYAALLDESTHPDVLRDALDRDRLLEVLWRESAAHPVLRAVSGAESAELWAGDVPLVTCRPGGTELTVGRLTVHGMLAESGLAQVRRRIARMGQGDLLDQEWVIRASLATRGTGAGHRPRLPPPGPVAAIAPAPESLLAAACGLADTLLATAQEDARRVNWLGLEPLDDRVWAVLPQGAGLPHGYCGTALFLAQLGVLTGTERYSAAARRALTAVPALLAALAAEPDGLADIGPGFAGLGGIAYALGRLGVLLADAEVAGWVAAAVDLAAAAADRAGVPGVLEGDAGCLAAMLAVHEETGSHRAAALARVCADRLAALAPAKPASGGFDTGAAGVGWALLRFAGAGGGAQHAAAGRAALRAAVDHHCAGAPPRAGWCDGASGTALALVDGAGAIDTPEAAALLDRAVARGAGTARDHSLCHGTAGALDLLLAAVAAGRADPAALHREAGALLGTLDRFGPRCGTPDSVTSPGLLTGLSGMGYELLRLGFSTCVPSVLLLRSPSESTHLPGSAPFPPTSGRSIR